MHSTGASAISRVTHFSTVQVFVREREENFRSRRARFEFQNGPICTANVQAESALLNTCIMRIWEKQKGKIRNSAPFSVDEPIEKRINLGVLLKIAQLNRYLKRLGHLGRHRVARQLKVASLLE